MHPASMHPASLDAPRLALALVEAQVGSLVEVLPVALLIADRQGKVLRANEAASELFEEPVLVGKCLDDLLRNDSGLNARQRVLVQADDVLRLVVIHPR